MSNRLTTTRKLALALYSVLVIALCYHCLQRHNFDMDIMKVSISQWYPLNIQDNRKCFLNDIFDGIFILSIPSRVEFAAKVLYQFNRINVSTKLWTGYSQNDTCRKLMFQDYRKKCQPNDDLNKTLGRIKEQHSPYHDYLSFAIRQGMLDMIRFAKQHNYDNLLIIEDDVILADTKYFNEFCCIYDKLPNDWDVLSIGVNELSKKKATKSYII